MRLWQLVWFFQRRLMAWLWPAGLPPARAAWLRRLGARIGEGCWICTNEFINEPCLLEIGDRVGVSFGTCFVTHEGTADPDSGVAIYGRISVGDNTYIGCNCVILPGTLIGRDCVIAAGSVVKGTVPDGCVAMGNPAQVVMTTAMARKLAARNPNRLQIHHLPPAERERVLRNHFGLSTGG
jgi:acetyltransferase-like isoleucine patch superfamily enzyme